MENSTQEQWQRDSQPSLEDLIALLTKLMASVQVTNPIAKADPALAIEQMAKVCLKFPLGLTRRVVEDIQTKEASAFWPRTGEMVVMLQQKIAADKELELRRRKALPGPAPMKKNRRGKILNILRSPAGQYALGVGYAPNLVDQILRGDLDLEEANTERCKVAMASSYHERMQIVAGLQNGTSKEAPALKGNLLQAVINLGTSVKRRNDYYLDVLKEIAAGRGHQADFDLVI